MPTLKDTLTKRKLAGMTGQALTPEAIISLQDLAHIREEFLALRDQLLEAIRTAKAAYKGDPGADAVVDYPAIVSEVLRRIPVPQDGQDADPVDERAIVARILSLMPPPEPGEPGEPGAAAEIDHEALAETMLTKIGERKIPAEHIDGIGKAMDAYWQRIKRQFPSGVFGGGGDTVTAGTNVTVTRLANGQRQISVPNASFSTLTATETPNGTRTVFTFATASAQPSYLVVDNVWMRATSAAGTANWTWSSAAKQATLLVSPADEIYGVV